MKKFVGTSSLVKGTGTLLHWTETWANYLSKEYFGTNWLGAKYGYVVQPLNPFNKSMIELAKMPIIWSPITPFVH